MAQNIMLLTAAAASAGDKAVTTVTNVTPFLHNREALVRFSAHAQAGTAPAWAVDGSLDNSTWTADIATSVVAGGEDLKTIIVWPYMRATVTTAAGSTDGFLTVSLEPLK
jgi:hypothetical protein